MLKIFFGLNLLLKKLPENSMSIKTENILHVIWEHFKWILSGNQRTFLINTNFGDSIKILAAFLNNFKNYSYLTFCLFSFSSLYFLSDCSLKMVKVKRLLRYATHWTKKQKKTSLKLIQKRSAVKLSF